MRAIWKGAVTFGLVNVPVKLYSATEDHDVGLHQVHDADGGRIRYQRRCEVCSEVVEYSRIAKAYDDGERTVVLTPNDLASLPVERSREIDVVEFVPREQIDPIMYESAYYLEPDSSSIKSYMLLVRTLAASDRVAIVNFSLRQRSRLGALRVRGDVLTLQALRWDDEVREPAFASLEESVRISTRELDMSAALVESFESDFTPEKFTDEYQAQLGVLIEAKLAQGDALDTAATFGEPDEEAPEKGADVIDLMEVLRRSVEKSRARQGDSPATSTTSTTSATPSTSAKSAKATKSAKPAKASKPAKSATSATTATSAAAPARQTRKKTATTATRATARPAKKGSGAGEEGESADHAADPSTSRKRA